MRQGSNSDALAEEFAKGAIDSGHKVEKISLINKTLNFCKGCMFCQKTKRCVIQDNGVELAEKIFNAEIVVFATPVYYYEMSGQMKTLLDRANPLYEQDYKFRDVYLIATAAENNASAIDGTINGLNGWISCFEKYTLKGVVRGTGATDIGDIQGMQAMEEAYKMGKNA